MRVREYSVLKDDIMYRFFSMVYLLSVFLMMANCTTTTEAKLKTELAIAQEAGLMCDGSLQARKEANKTGLPSEAVLSVMDKSANVINACYVETLKHNNKASGIIKMNFVIKVDGAVRGVCFIEKDSSFISSRLFQCIRKEVLGWKFPTTGGSEVAVKFPYRFSLD